MNRLPFWGIQACLLVLLIGVSLTPAQLLPASAPTPPKPPYQRLLQGDDAKRAAALQKRIDELVQQDKLEDAIPAAKELTQLRAGVQGEDHWETGNERQQVKTLQHLSGKTPQERARYRHARTLAGEADALEAKAQPLAGHPLREAALAIDRQVLGEAHPLTARSCLSLARNLNLQDRYAEADVGHHKALDLLRQLYGESHPDVALAHDWLAGNALALAQHAVAEESFRKALALRRHLLGETHAATANTYHYLGVCLHVSGQYAAADEVLRKTLALRRQLLGEVHSDTVETRSVLALNLYWLGRYAEAEEEQRQVLVLCRQLFGEAHPNTAQCYNNLACSVNEQGRYSEAEQGHRQALALRRQLLGETHHQIANSYNNLALSLQAQGRYAEAQECFRQAVVVYRQTLGEGHAATALSYDNLALNLFAQGRHVEAEAGFRKAQELRRQVYRRPHEVLATSYAHLALSLHAQGQYAEAEAGYRQALALRRQLLGEAHPTTAQCYYSLASVLHAQGQYSAAAEYHRRALVLRRQLYGELHPAMAQSYVSLASTLDAQGEHAAGEASFRKALALRRQLLGETHADTAQSYQGLATNLAMQGRYAEAEEAFTHSAEGFLRARVAIARSGLDRAARTGERSPLPYLAALLARNRKPGEAWQRLEQGLGRSTWDEMSARLRRSATEQARLNQLEARLRHLDTLLETRNANLTSVAEQEPQRKRHLEEQQQTLEDLAACYRQLEQKYGVREGAVYTLEQIQALLSADTAFLAWVDIAGEAHAHDPNGEHWAVVVRQRGLPVWVRLSGTGAQQSWTRDDDALAGTLRSLVSGPEATARSDWPALVQRLQAQRIDPIRSHLGPGAGLPGVRHVLVLHSTKMEGVPVELLLEGRTVSYTPSATLATHLRQQPQSPCQGLLALGDPVFGVPRGPDQLLPLPGHGLLLRAVQPGSNAAQAGLRPNDVLLRYNRTRLEKRDDLKSEPEGPDAPKAVPVELWRDGKTLARTLRPGKLGVVLAEAPAPIALDKQRQSDRLLVSARGGEWKPLPGTRAEVEALQRLFAARKEPVRVLTDSNASEQKLRELADRGELANYRYLHLATHGEMVSDRPLQSAVILSRDALPDPGQQLLANKPIFDGILTAGKVLEQWRLDAELVTLSACQSGLGKFERGEGFMGFAQALLLTGARSVCLSLWKVDDTATALLMERFYQNLRGQRDGLSGPLKKAAALAEAKQWLRTLPRDEALQRAAVLTKGVARGKNQPLRPLLSEVPATAPASPAPPPYAHPYYWAAFVLIGDPE